MTNPRILLFLIISITCFLGIPRFTAAAGASLYFSPNGGTFFVGSTFDVSIFVNTGGNDINAVKIDLKFDPKKIQIASPTAGKSFISVWIAQPTYSNIDGKASFQGGMPSPGINTSAGLVSTVTFRVVAPGETSVYFLESSKILLDDGKGSNVLTSLSKGVYALTIPPPEGPKIFSSTHPDQNKWYRNNNPTFSWEKEPLVTAFSYNVSQSFYDEPDNISEGNHTSISFTDLKDGIWYFSVKARKDGVWGGVSRYIVQIDATPPAIFEILFEPILKSVVSISREPIIRFITTDALSGIDHYEFRHIDLTGEEKEEGFFIEVSGPYKLPTLSLGEHDILVRAFDMAGNWRDSAKKLEVIPIDRLIYVTKKGVYIWTILFSWRKVFLLLIILLILVLTLLYLWWKSHGVWRERKKSWEEKTEKAKKEEEEIKRKLYGP